MIGVQDLILPKRKIAVPLPPSYIKFDGAFGLGQGTELGDKSRYRSHGTISGVDWATGAHGKCLDFDATAKDYVEIAAAYDQLDFTSEDFSIIVRVYVDDLSVARAIFCRGLTNTDGYMFSIEPASYLTFYTSQSAAIQYTQSSIGVITTGSWLTLGVSRDGASVKLYKSGVDVSEIIGTHINPDTCARSAKIGVRNDLSSWLFDGKIEFLRIFGGVALPASTHLAYHNALA